MIDFIAKTINKIYPYFAQPKSTQSHFSRPRIVSMQ